MAPTCLPIVSTLTRFRGKVASSASTCGKTCLRMQLSRRSSKAFSESRRIRLAGGSEVAAGLVGAGDGGAPGAELGAEPGLCRVVNKARSLNRSSAALCWICWVGA